MFMAEDMSEVIGWEEYSKNYKKLNIEVNNDVDLKKYLSQKVILSPPTRKPMQISSDDGAIHIGLNYENLLK